MSFLVGPVSSVGHPFNVGTEVPVERVLTAVDETQVTAYGFHTKWLYTDLKIVPDEPLEAVVVWDPGWVRSGEGAGAIDELYRIWQIAQEFDVPVIGVYSDWFASWQATLGLAGTLGSLMTMDALIIDPAGAAALRLQAPMKTKVMTDDRYRPIVEMPQYLTYGRLPRVGAGEVIKKIPLHDREVDVSMVSTMHPQHVVFRPYYVEAIREFCAERGWSFEFRDRATPSEMEELYLNSKIVANVSLGTQPNYRVYEALACGAALVTDAWNIGLGDAPVWKFNGIDSLHEQLDSAMSMSYIQGDAVQRRATAWARQHSPERVWADILLRCREVAPTTVHAREARKKRAEEFHGVA